MPVNVGMAQLSDHFLLLTVVLYSLAMLAYAGELAYGRRRVKVTASQREPELALAGASGRRTTPSGPAPGRQPHRSARGPGFFGVHF